MPFKIGNEEYKKAIITGRPPKYKPMELLEKFEEYVNWCREGDGAFLQQEKTKKSEGKGDDKRTQDTNKAKRFRAPVSERGFCNYIGANKDYLTDLLDRKNHNFTGVVQWIKEFCREDKVRGASVGVYNASIISQLLGLVTKSERKHDFADDMELVLLDDDDSDE